jgi:hypothetical protein
MFPLGFPRAFRVRTQLSRSGLHWQWRCKHRGVWRKYLQRRAPGRWWVASRLARRPRELGLAALTWELHTPRAVRPTSAAAAFAVAPEVAIARSRTRFEMTEGDDGASV